MEARQAAGLTQTELARRLGRPQSYISKVELGERRVDLVELIDLADAVGFDLQELVEEVRRINPDADLRERDASVRKKARK